MIITIYELLGLIKDGEAPHTILFKNEVWFWGYDTYTTFECLNKTPDSQISLFSKYRIDYCLNDIVEIIDKEENKPIIEKINGGIITSRAVYTNFNDVFKDMSKSYETIDDIIIKLNEVIDYLNRKEDKNN